MQGRLEKDIKNENLIQYNLTWLPHFAEEWYLNLKATGHSSQTCVEYLRKLHAYFNSIKPIFTNEVEAADLTYESVIKYFLSIRIKKDKNGNQSETTDSYKKSVWCCLNSFFSFMVKRGYLTHNFMEDIPNLPNHDEEKIKNKRVRLTADDYKMILEQLDKDIKKDITKTENKAVILLLMNTGMRRNALANINVEDVDVINKKLRVIDKGNEEHLYSLNDMCLDALREWMRVRTHFYIRGYSDALFLNRQGQRLSSTSIANYVYDATEKALGMRLSPHKLRAGFCSIMYEQTGDIEKVRRMVGHKQVSTTQRYIVTDNSEKEEAASIMESLLI